MSVGVRSIEDRLSLRRAWSIALIAGLALALAACAGSPFGRRLDPTMTASIGPKPAAAVAASDIDAMHRAIGDGFFTAAAGSEIEWSNSATGSSGTISPLAEARPRSGGACRPFAVNLSDSRGVRRYLSEACRLEDGVRQIGRLMPEDALLS